MKNIAIIIGLVLFNMFAVNAQAPSFEDFKAQFAAATLPFSMTTETLIAQEASAAKAKRLGWDFYQFLPELERSAKASNMPVYPEPVAVFETEDRVAFLYNIARGLNKGAKSYAITLYDRQGAYIATNYVGGINAKYITSLSVDANLMASVQQMDRSTEMVSAQMIDLSVPGNPDQLEWSTVEVKTLSAKK